MKKQKKFYLTEETISKLEQLNKKFPEQSESALIGMLISNAHENQQNKVALELERLRIIGNENNRILKEIRLIFSKFFHKYFNGKEETNNLSEHEIVVESRIEVQNHLLKQQQNKAMKKQHERI